MNVDGLKVMVPGKGMWCVDTPGIMGGATTAPTQLKFTSYNAPKAIPTSIEVPCDGTGQVEFSSCPYLAPCAYGWIPAYVSVRFVNIAA